MKSTEPKSVSNSTESLLSKPTPLRIAGQGYQSAVSAMPASVRCGNSLEQYAASIVNNCMRGAHDEASE